MRVLLVEARDEIRTALSLALRAEGFGVETAEADMVASLARTEDFDVLLVGDPGEMSGVAMVACLRGAREPIAAMVLNDERGVDRRLAAFRAGADDVMAAPYDRAELMARLVALARRARGHAHPVLSAGPLTLDLGAKLVRVEGRPVHLTGREYQILEALMVRKGSTLSKGALMDQVYCGMADEPDLKIVDVFVCKVRKKLGAVSPLAAQVLTTVWGHGYRIVEPAAQAQAA